MVLKNYQKKGVFFSLLSLIIISIFAILISNVNDAKIESAKLTLERNKLDAGNSFVKFIDEVYIPRILVVTLRKATIEIIDQIESDGQFVARNYDQLNETYNNLMKIGSMSNSVPYNNFGFNNMDDYNLQYWLDSIVNDVYDNLLFDVNFDVTNANITIYQDKPFLLNANLSIYFTLVADNVNWSINKNYTSEINIEGLKDPAYAKNGYTNIINDNSEICNSVDIYGYCIWFSKDEFETYMYNANMYEKNVSGASFIERLMGNFDNSDNGNFNNMGIQSMIVPRVNGALSVPGVTIATNVDDDPDESSSYLDFKFFGNREVANMYPFPKYQVKSAISGSSYDYLWFENTLFNGSDAIWYNITMNYCDAGYQSYIDSCADE